MYIFFPLKVYLTFELTLGAYQAFWMALVLTNTPICLHLSFVTLASPTGFSLAYPAIKLLSHEKFSLEPSLALQDKAAAKVLLMADKFGSEGLFALGPHVVGLSAVSLFLLLSRRPSSPFTVDL